MIEIDYDAFRTAVMAVIDQIAAGLTGIDLNNEFAPAGHDLVRARVEVANTQTLDGIARNWNEHGSLVSALVEMGLLDS